MGRKGIGKLAAFGICRTIEVISAGSTEADRTGEGWPVSHIVLDLDDMLCDTETGWVAYSKQPYRDEAMAGVRIYARGKIVAQTRDFGIGHGFTGEFKLNSYLVGAIHVDWLDDEEDLVRSDRQDIIWNSGRGEALEAWRRELIYEIGRMGERSIRRRVWEEFDQVLEAIAPGNKMFRESVVAATRILVSNKDRAALDETAHVESTVRLVVSLGPQRSLLETLQQIAADADPRLDVVVALFERARVAEIYSLGQIAGELVAVVDKLRRLIDDRRSLERPFQELIERAPWLLAPEWTPLGMNESLKRVRASFERWYTQRFGVTLLTTAIGGEKREPDFVLLHASGELWIVEIKRMDYHLTDEEYNRAINYLYALDTFLTENPRIGAQFPRRRLTFIVDHIDKLRPASRSSLDSDARVDRCTWRELLDSTLRAHRDFLERVYAMRGADEESAQAG
jgi:hypothetical protein